MVIGIMLVRNEAYRWLAKVLEQMKRACNEIIIVDDASTDETADICSKYTDRIFYTRKTMWGKNELFQRQRLWNEAENIAHDGDWILCLDADETIHHIEQLCSRIDQAELMKCDGLAFNLYDMWDDCHYRSDGLWNAHLRDWVMMVRYNPDKEYVWRETPLHCGRFPLNAVTLCGNTGLAIQHWGWSRPEDRQAKYDRYMKADPEGKSGSLAQYISILDPNPVLRRFET